LRLIAQVNKSSFLINQGKLGSEKDNRISGAR